MSLEQIIAELIESKKEGDYWDFKREHHHDTNELIKDIICLANTVRHNGDRYLIFGIDNSFQPVNFNKKEQSIIIDSLSKADFAGQNYPDVYLHDIQYLNQTLQVLVIKDKAEKPYYLEKDKITRNNNKEKIIKAGTIYSRVRDKNTANDSVASPSDIEKMWRERFGLDLSPLERFEAYLSDYNNWIKTSDKKWYYKEFPEFTIEIINTEDYRDDFCQSWHNNCFPNPSVYQDEVAFRYHQTELYEKRMLLYLDGAKYHLPLPEMATINPTNTFEFQNSYYYFCLDSFNGKFLQFIIKNMPQDNDPLPGILLLVFDTEQQKHDFERYICDNINILNHIKKQVMNSEENIDKRSKFISELKTVFEVWKNSKSSDSKSISFFI